MWTKFVKDEKGFTGLEAAIVLIAFVVVAAVFSYVMLGAGFFTTQKSQEVVHTGVAQASSSVELSGDVIAKGDGGLTEIDTVNLCLQLTSGGSSVDIAKTLIVVTAPDIKPAELKLGGTANATNFVIATQYNSNSNNLIDKFEKFDVTVDLDAVAAAATPTTSVGANKDFTIEVKPPMGASYTIHRKAPPAIAAIMTLV
ncbi:MAG: archaellin/type IV pilin N-terminal domain-containing protein [Methanosarcina sp.]